MTDTIQLLDGTVEDVKTRLIGLDSATLAAVLAEEQAGKNRKGDADTATTATDISAPSVTLTTAASLDHSAVANIASATEFEPSGAPVQTSQFDLDHMALDANPRANTTEDQNRIDFNDPIRTGEEIVTARLRDQAAA